MARPREFDRDAALTAAIEMFWSKGFAATSTEDLVQAMGIGRQSFYNAFGDKRRLYLEALETYQRNATSCHIGRLTAPASPLDGLRDLLIGLIPDDDALRCRGCLGAGSVGEFGVTEVTASPLAAMMKAGRSAAASILSATTAAAVTGRSGCARRWATPSTFRLSARSRPSGSRPSCRACTALASSA